MTDANRRERLGRTGSREGGGNGEDEAMSAAEQGQAYPEKKLKDPVH